MAQAGLDSLIDLSRSGRSVLESGRGDRDLFEDLTLRVEIADSVMEQGRSSTLAQARGAANLISHFGDAGDVAAARTLYGDLAEIAAQHPDEPEVRLEQAHGAFNLIDVYGSSG